MITHTIVTSYDLKPSPIRYFDWVAVLDGYQEEDYLGHGETEIEAITNLLNKREEE